MSKTLKPQRREPMLYSTCEIIDKVINPYQTYFSDYIKKHLQNSDISDCRWLIIAFKKKYNTPTLHKQRNFMKSSSPQIMQIKYSFEMEKALEYIEQQGFEDVRFFSVPDIMTLIRN